jgi:cation:H+ antiporter
MFLDSAILLASLLVILFSCIIFVNAIELLGKALNLHQGIVGSILAAVGTALPETLIPVIAILFTGGKAAHDVGIGAIAGAPFMLATLAFFVTGAAILVYSLLGKRTMRMNADIGNLTRDLVFFILYYGIAVSATFYRGHVILKAIVALGLLASYPLYIRNTIKSEGKEIENPGELYLARFARLPSTLPFILAQLCAGLTLLVVGAHYFVEYVQALSLTMGVSPLILSLIITPIATELPEKINSIIWVGQRKDTLALGNITGAMVFQSCFPVVFGMLFTEWELKGVTLVSAACALASAGAVLAWIKLRKSVNPVVLCLGGAFYVALILHLVFLWKK